MTTKTTTQAKEPTKGASAAPTKAKLQAMVLAKHKVTGAKHYVATKLGSTTMSTPSAYELAKRYRENPLTGSDWDYQVLLLKREDVAVILEAEARALEDMRARHRAAFHVTEDKAQKE